MDKEQRSIRIMRSLLFVPSIVERFVQRAPKAGADVICLDLEDSIPPAEKARARAMAAEAIDTMPRTGYAAFVRVNAVHTGLLEDDLISVVRPGLDAIVLPKTDSAEAVERADHYLTILERQAGMETGAIGIVPLIESAVGILNCREICAASPRLVGASLGAEDLAADMGMIRSKAARELDWPRAQLSTAAAAAGVVAIDTPEPDYADSEHLERDASLARSLGFRGKYCIHPDQVDVVNRVFSPSEQEISEAREIVRLLDEEGIAKGRAAIPINGKMIDTPAYCQAKRLLRWAEAAGVSAKE